MSAEHQNPSVSAVGSSTYPWGWPEWSAALEALAALKEMSVASLQANEHGNQTPERMESSMLSNKFLSIWLRYVDSSLILLKAWHRFPYGKSTVSCFLLKLDYKGKEKKEESVVLLSLSSTIIFSLGIKILTAQNKKAVIEDKTIGKWDKYHAAGKQSSFPLELHLRHNCLLMI